jgi:SAM-dependent methyltransferase
MRLDFVHATLKYLELPGQLTPRHRVLAVCAGSAENVLFKNLGFQQVTLSGLDPSLTNEGAAPFSVARADAMSLPFPNNSFDWVFVSDGLHHCDSPHRALLEMYRVARVGVIVFESRDSVLMRLGVRLGWVEEYELSAVIGNGGVCAGVNYTCVPNYVYRWTERDFEKTICCADPTGRPAFRYFYGFNAPQRDYTGLKKLVYKGAVLGGRLFSSVFKKQSNSFCLVAFKPSTLFPWLQREGDTIKFKTDFRNMK